MELDSRMVTSMVLIAISFVLMALTPLYKQGSRWRRAALVGGAVFVVLVVLELVWPQGTPPPWG